MKKFVLTFLKKTKVVFIVAVFFVFAMVVVYISMFTMIKNKTTAYTEMAQTTQAQIDVFYTLTNQKKLISSTADSRDQLTSYFVDQGSVGNFFEQLEEIAEKTGVEFSVISARLGKTSDEGLRVQVSADGTFRNVYYFLTLLEAAPFGINITTLDMHTNSVDEVSIETRQPWRGTFDIEVVTYLE